jgi:integrative and conjugative element protein (TIGR02256 family)
MIIVDASASLEVPRSLAPMEAIGKCVSVFFTPNARDSVLLGEDSGRTIRLDSLESQYYRAILRNDWGYSHLAGHLDPLRYGGGCRDLSHQMPYDLVSLHGSLLARQIRLYSFGVEAKAFVWQTLEAPFSIAVHELNIWPPLSIQCDSWRVHWDEGIKKEMRDTRTKALPSETGGVLLGYRDHVLKTIYIVDSIPAPPDSHSSPDFFERGFEGLVGKVEEASRRTSRIVTYIGEWHSHPKGASVSPSSRDKILFNYLLHYFATEGLPAVMLIIGDSDETWIASEFSF